MHHPHGPKTIQPVSCYIINKLQYPEQLNFQLYEKITITYVIGFAAGFYHDIMLGR